LKYMAEDRKEQWNIQVPPLWRMATFDTGSDNICAVWSFHHAILDGWSNASLMTELNNTYLALINDKHYMPSRLKISYRDFIIEEIAEKKKITNVDSWKMELADYKRIAFPVPTKNGRDEIHNFTAFIDGPLREKLIEISKRFNTTLKHTCFAAYLYMLGMLTYDNDITTGLVSHNRPGIEDGDKLIGCFLNTLPFRINIPDSISYEDYIQLVDSKLVHLKRYEKITFYEIVKAIGENNQENPIFDTIYNYIDFHIYKQVIGNDDQVYDGNIAIQSYERTNTFFDFTVSPGSQGISVGLGYDTSFIDDEWAKKLYYYFESFLDKMVSRPQELVKKDELLSAGEKQVILYELNDTEAGYPNDKTIHQLFVEQAAQTPDYIALHGCMIAWMDDCIDAWMHGMHLSYRELNEQSDQLAWLLIEKGVLADNIVGIMIDRSIETIIGIIGILKSGGAYLPIDPEYPQERIDYMLKDSNAKILLTDEKKKNNCQCSILNCQLSMSGCPRSGLHHSSFIIHHSNLSYVIYTSGTSGRPKGVMVPHAPVVNLIYSRIKGFNIAEKERVLQFSSLSFDASVEQIFIALCSGAVVVSIDKETLLGGEGFEAYILRQAITHLDIVPSFLKQMRLSGSYGFKRIVSGGEICPVELAKKWAQYYAVYNVYGPSEATVTAMEMPVNGNENWNSVPVGKPIANTTIYILDKNMN
ncbi:MAG: AMP-binding protein, partial [Acidobacteria bacterium]|nr:AMP-binding protein [Acidobacteriota bacterium]